jgi:hypothetical protein
MKRPVLFQHSNTSEHKHIRYVAYTYRYLATPHATNECVVSGVSSGLLVEVVCDINQLFSCSYLSTDLHLRHNICQRHRRLVSCLTSLFLASLPSRLGQKLLSSNATVPKKNLKVVSLCVCINVTCTTSKILHF